MSYNLNMPFDRACRALSGTQQFKLGARDWANRSEEKLKSVANLPYIKIKAFIFVICVGSGICGYECCYYWEAIIKKINYVKKGFRYVLRTLYNCRL